MGGTRPGPARSFECGVRGRQSCGQCATGVVACAHATQGLGCGRSVRRGCMKPVTPLRAENGQKMAVSCEQRCQWLQTCAVRSSQRCRRFHLEAVSHPHWCHRFQARRSAGVVRQLWPHRREKVRPAGVDSGPNREIIRPAGENRPILGCFVCAGRTFSRVGADGGEQGEFCRACRVWIGLG